MSTLEQVIPEGYKQTKVGIIPIDWDVYTLGELSELTSSKRIFESDYVNDGVPFYRGQEIRVRFPVYAPIKQITTSV
ncbi:hypothetical protein GT360_18305 [Vibrio astriarenae]|uniref:Restriction endonuclease subunit S n=1 Tax=Vibrio astriarenae TaxID=1481923 RepID=A0A7Z2YFK2_9VIBR|nr:hypothetical protein [Vibrio astriarenae]QIA65491.1 hypothetical protein GT360_18305 [Vibrio astriarenae]